MKKLKSLLNDCFEKLQVKTNWIAEYTFVRNLMKNVIQSLNISNVLYVNIRNAKSNVLT